MAVKKSQINSSTPRNRLIEHDIIYQMGIYNGSSTIDPRSSEATESAKPASRIRRRRLISRRVAAVSIPPGSQHTRRLTYRVRSRTLGYPRSGPSGLTRRHSYRRRDSRTVDFQQTITFRCQLGADFRASSYVVSACCRFPCFTRMSPQALSGSAKCAARSCGELVSARASHRSATSL